MQTNAAMKTALAVIDAQFHNPERNNCKHILKQGGMVQDLVEGGRYSYPEACRLINVSYAELKASFDWMIDDNARCNALFDTELFCMFPYQWPMLGWFAEQDKQQPSATVVQFQGAA